MIYGVFYIRVMNSTRISWKPTHSAPSRSSLNRSRLGRKYLHNISPMIRLIRSSMFRAV